MTNKECSIVTIDGEGFDKLQGKVIDEENAHDYINPNELHALEVRQIQLLKAQVKQQAKEIAELKQLVKDLTTK
jgi:predicted HD phosphohydrolase